MRGDFVVVSSCLQRDMIAPFSVLFHPLHVGFPVFGYELPVPIRLAPQLVDGCSATFCVAVLVTVEQLICQRPKLAVAIGLNFFFHHAALAQALEKRRSFNRLLTRMCVLLCLTLMLVINEPILEDPMTCYLPFLLRSYARTYVTRLRALLLPFPPCISLLQSTFSAVKLPLCVFYHLLLLDDDSSKPFYRVLG